MSSGSVSHWWDNYMTIEALEDGLTVTLTEMNTNYKLEYSLDGETWTRLSSGKYTPEINTRDVIAFKGDGSSYAMSNQGLGTFSISKKCNLLGNCMSLLYGDDVVGNDTAGMYSFNYLFYKCSSIISIADDFLPATYIGSYAYYHMFDSCTSMIKGPNLPALQVNVSSYAYMFYGCISLVSAPELPATQLSTYCYFQMFYGCSSLVNAPVLPAETLAASCYHAMFVGCSSLKKAPVLPAKTLMTQCYMQMFYGCKNLNYIKAMFTTTPSTTYTSSWVYGVASTGTFIKNKDATWTTTGIHGMPEGWTIKTE